MHLSPLSVVSWTPVWTVILALHTGFKLSVLPNINVFPMKVGWCLKRAYFISVGPGPRSGPKHRSAQ